MTRIRVAPQFIDGAAGRILLVVWEPSGPARDAVLVVPPFAEELNKSRRMLALAARELAARGMTVALPDLFGTGDSEGELRAADLDLWCADLALTCAWLSARGTPAKKLLALRLGGAIGMRCAQQQRLSFERSCFWQPVLQGSQFVAQFLRLRIAASMMGRGPRESAADLQARLTSDGFLEVAGYELSAKLAGQLQALEFNAELAAPCGTVRWLELARTDPPALASASAKAIEHACAGGVAVQAEALYGEPFWSSTEIVTNELLVARTADFLAPTAAAVESTRT